MVKIMTLTVLLVILISSLSVTHCKKGKINAKKQPKKQSDKKTIDNQTCPVKKVPKDAPKKTPGQSFINATRSVTPNKLIIIMIDGIKPDYVMSTSNDYLPTINKYFKENGVHSVDVEPIYPSKSYPNWYAISTGLHAESHGMTGNTFYDSKLRKKFIMHDEESFNDYWWNQTEPIWINAEKSGHKVGMFYWDGCQISNGGVKASFCRELKPFEDWFMTGNYESDYYGVFSHILSKFHDNSWTLAMVYYEMMDAFGHKFGTMSKDKKFINPVLADAMRSIDRNLAYLFSGLRNANLDSKVSVVLVSDHGMADFGPSFGTKFVSVSDHVSESDVEVSLESGSYIMIYLKKGVSSDNVIDKAKKTLPAGVRIYKKSEIPEHFHYKNHDSRIGDILLVASRGYQLVNYEQKMADVAIDHGAHGYEVDQYPEMRTFFGAWGPNIKKGVKISGLKNVDHYSLFCSLINIKPHANNGTISKLNEILNNN